MYSTDLPSFYCISTVPHNFVLTWSGMKQEDSEIAEEGLQAYPTAE